MKRQSGWQSLHSDLLQLVVSTLVQQAEREACDGADEETLALRGLEVVKAYACLCATSRHWSEHTRQASTGGVGVRAAWLT